MDAPPAPVPRLVLDASSGMLHNVFGKVFHAVPDIIAHQSTKLEHQECQELYAHVRPGVFPSFLNQDGTTPMK